MTRMRGEQILRTAYDGQQNFIRRSLRQADKFCIRAKPKHSFVEILVRLKRCGWLGSGVATGDMNFKAQFCFAAHDTNARRDLKLIFQSSGSRTLATHKLKT